jgi:alpha-L-rhamnosidase
MTSHSLFLHAMPVWPASLSGQVNLWVSFHARVELPRRARCTLRLAAAQAYRVWANGVFAGRGPARAGHGCARIDEWPLVADATGGLEVVIEVMSYGVPTFCTTLEPEFLCAELIAGKKACAWTEVRGGGFKAEHRRERVQKIERYSYQRPFVEAYRFGPEGITWQMPGYVPAKPLALARVRHRRQWLARGVALPDFSEVLPRLVAVRGRASFSAVRARKARPHRFIHEVPQQSAGYTQKQVEWSLFRDVAGLKFSTTGRERLRAAAPVGLSSGQWLRVDFGAVRTGFPGLRLRAVRATRLLLVFDELLLKGQIVFDRSACLNTIGLELAAGAELNFESFEPYTFQHLEVVVLAGAAEVADISLRNFINAEKVRPAPAGLPAAEAKVRQAALASFRQNALDIFMDCPSRERAGWLCDSLFTARAEWHLCGDNPIERAFLENYLRPAKFADLPAGMVPMCYPAEALQKMFIPNWAMFLVLQLDEAGRERRLPSAWRPLVARRVRGLLGYFRRFENELGLLEKLENWVFVEWSKANQFVQDVNFPSNMLYAATLRAAARLLREPALAKKAARIESTIRDLAWRDGHFVDNALRGPDGKLTVTDNASEVCQYYAFSYGFASPRRDRALWQRLVRGDYGTLFPANAFIGKLLRLELLIAHGEAAAAQRELMRNFAPMARRTGTLWEHLDDSASCNHGFTSYIAVLIDRLHRVARSKR